MDSGEASQAPTSDVQFKELPQNSEANDILIMSFKNHSEKFHDRQNIKILDKGSVIMPLLS